MKSHRGRITNKKAFRVAARRYLQVRAEELKNLEEKRAALVEEGPPLDIDERHELLEIQCREVFEGNEYQV